LISKLKNNISASLPKVEEIHIVGTYFLFEIGNLFMPLTPMQGGIKLILGATEWIF